MPSKVNHSIELIRLPSAMEDFLFNLAASDRRAFAHFLSLLDPEGVRALITAIQAENHADASMRESYYNEEEGGDEGEWEEEGGDEGEWEEEGGDEGEWEEEGGVRRIFRVCQSISTNPPDPQARGKILMRVLGAKTAYPYFSIPSTPASPNTYAGPEKLGEILLEIFRTKIKALTTDPNKVLSC